MAERRSGHGDIVKGKSRADWRRQALVMAFVALVNLFCGLNIRHDLAGAWPWPAALPFTNLVIAVVVGAYAWACWQRSRVLP